MRDGLLIALAVSFLAALACGGGDSGAGAGTGLSEGPIEAFGSIWVNGVEWELDGAVITVDGQRIDEDDLELGMFARVRGDRDDGPSGRAHEVEIDDELKGPIESMADVSQDEKRLVVLSYEVVVRRGSTAFLGTDFDSLQVDQVVEVHGYVDGAGGILATFVEFEEIVSYGDSKVKFSGTVGGLSGDHFRIRDIDVAFDPGGGNTELELDGPLVNGRFVEVKGIIDAPRDVFATEIEDEDRFDDDDRGEVEVEGFVQEFNGIDDFVVGRFRVDAASARIEGGPGAIQNGVLVEVEGALRDGILFAEEVELEDHDDDDEEDDDDDDDTGDSDDS
jgi:hypothetical protein